MKAHLIIQLLGEDYHGVYESVLFVYADLIEAQKKVKELEEVNTNCSIEYTIETFKII